METSEEGLHREVEVVSEETTDPQETDKEAVTGEEASLRTEMIAEVEASIEAEEETVNKDPKKEKKKEDKETTKEETRVDHQKGLTVSIP